MEYNELIDALTVLTHGFLGFYVMLLAEFREPVRIWRVRWAVPMVLITVFNAYLRVIFGGDVFVRIAVLTMTLPTLLITQWCSRYKGLRVVFNVCTCLWIGCIGDSVGILAQALLDHVWIRLVLRVILYLILSLVVLHIRPYYQRMLQILDRGWSVLCLIPGLTFLIILFLLSNLLPISSVAAAGIICAVTAICTCAYFLMYLFFIQVLQEYELKNSRDLMSVQISALERQLNANQEAEEAMRIQRHDMRHQWTTLSALVQQGDRKAIQQFIGTAQKQLDETAAVRWCQNSVLNAVFSAYFTRAAREKIEIKAELDIPDELPVNASELSMVFANALENAVKACSALRIEQRKIICKCIEQPGLMLQVENPYEGEILFDSEGLPVSKEEGHGTGTRSIMAFCRKYGAVWDYQARDGWFRLRISL